MWKVPLPTTLRSIADVSKKTLIGMETVRNRKTTKIKSKPLLLEGENNYIENVEKICNKHELVRQMGDGESNPEPPEKETIKGNNCDSEDTWSTDSIEEPSRKFLNIHFEIDLVWLLLLLLGLVTRMYKLEEPQNIVFDELHYGKYVSLYMKRTFFFDSHPPLGKQLIAGAAYLAGFDGNFKFSRIGSPYLDTVPLFALRLVPAFCGSLLMPIAYSLMLHMGLSQYTSILAAFLILFDNALLSQSRFILMESMLLMFSLFGLLCILKFRHYQMKPYSLSWWFWLVSAFCSLTCALCVKYAGFYSCCLGLAILGRDYWKLLSDNRISDRSLLFRFVAQAAVIISVPLIVYLSVFYVHLNILTHAGPHDSIMTSAYQASLDGGLASITKGQPLLVAHGSQITLRHTHGRTCWLHSHSHLYPIRYPDKRGSSHQQQVTCYSFKDVNNWWIVKRPNKNDLVVENPVDAIKHGDIIQLVHGITSRALNSHDVAAPMSPQSQEVSCYIDYNVSMPAQNLWQVSLINKEQTGDTWHTIQSMVKLLHVNTSQALKFSGRQLPEWGFNQHEIVTDKIINQDDTIWNVEEHRYTKSEDQKERERELVNAEMIPTAATSLSFWEKLLELQYKMLVAATENVQNHMYSSEPLEWPLLSRGIAYWVSSKSNAQVHLLGNIVIWYSSTFSLLLYCLLLTFYLLRRRRKCYDLDQNSWNKFVLIGEVFLTGYLFHFVPYFFVERTLFLHHYLPAFIYKVLLTAALIEHIYFVIRKVLYSKFLAAVFLLSVILWLTFVFYVFVKFSVLCYGINDLSTNDVLNLRWKDTWDFIVHKN